MSDLSDVENALVKAIADVLFPNTTYQPYTVATSVVNIQTRLMRGWPVDSQLNIDLANGITTVSVFSAPGVAKNATKFLRNTTAATVAQADTTMTATKAGSAVTFAGTASVSEVIGIGVRKPGPAGYGFSYRMLSSDTPTSVASTFAANLPGATSTGPVLTVNAPSAQIVVETGGDVTTLYEVHRNQQLFMVTVWAANVTDRDTICSVIDPALIWTNHLIFPDGSVSEPVIGAGTLVDDCVQKENMWKRTLYYSITYPTEYAVTETIMVLGKDTLSDSVTLID